MSQQPFMQFYVADYLADTLALSAEQHGAYLLLLCAMWRAGGRVQNNAKTLAKICRITPRRWNNIAPDILAMLTEIEDGKFLTQKRLMNELNAADEKREKLREAGSRGGKARSENIEAKEKQGLNNNKASLKPPLEEALSKRQATLKHNQNQNQNISSLHSDINLVQNHENSQNFAMRKSSSQADETSGKEQGCGQRESSPLAEAALQKEAEKQTFRKEFIEVFWPKYPCKKGKKDAQKAFINARKKAEIAEIMSGLQRYKAGKPLDRPWLHPATFLNGERWLDEPDMPITQGSLGQAPPKNVPYSILVESMAKKVHWKHHTMQDAVAVLRDFYPNISTQQQEADLRSALEKSA